MVSFPFLFPFVSACFSSDNYTAADTKLQALFCLRKEEEQGKIKKKKGGFSMNLNEIIAVNLKRLRAERGFSLGKLSELSGVSKVMLSQIEKGESTLPSTLSGRLQAAYRFPYTKLIDEQIDAPLLIQKRGKRYCGV